LRRISVVVLLDLLVLVLTATMALPAFAGGTTDAGNPKNGFGAVVSQKASTYHDVGEHSRDPDRDGKFGERREGIGNVARNEGGNVGDHGCAAGKMDDGVGADPEGVTNCHDKPGR
jgi:hypothetical protein